jgi:adenine-specific DNA-methyltransferase
LSQTPSLGTLRPCKEESKDWDTTQNLYIEGDNLEVLKLLQKSYYGKVKIIYIDPPYNTGNDFVYKDDFHDSLENYKKLTGQVDSEGNRMSTNTEASGRYHTDWLNMMYPRLRLARNLLRDDGVIFISIDDNEVHNLRKICDEVFGEDNFIACIIWERAYSPVNLKKHFSENHDFILCYAKSIDNCICNGIKRSDDANDRYKNPDNDPRGPWKSSDLSVGPIIEEKVYEITTPSGRKVYPPNGYCWRLTKERFEEFVNDNRIWFGEDGNNVPSIKRFLSEVKDTII